MPQKMKYGKVISIYLQNGLIRAINEALRKNKGLYMSRNHFINCAIIRELRRKK